MVLLRYGIPNYRLPKDRLGEDIQAILDTGVQVKHGLRIGTDVTVQELRASYDAVLITIGASTDKKLGIEGEDAEGVMSAVRFLRDVGKGINPDLAGQEVAIVGGGNVSMDAVRSAVQTWRKESEHPLPPPYRRYDLALPAEIEGAIAEGVETPHPSCAVTH